MKRDWAIKARLSRTLRAGLVVALSLPMFFQPDAATAYAPVEAQIIKDFSALEKFIAEQKSLTGEQRGSLQDRLSAAKAAFAAGQPCSAAASLSDFAAQSQQLRQGDLASLAEDLQNRGWRLRADILLSLPPGRSCDNAPRFQQEPLIEKTASDNRHLQGRVSFGEMMLQTMKERGEVFTKLRIPGVRSEVGDTGSPALPVFSRLIAVPQGATARVSFITGPARTIKLNLYPFQTPQTTRFKPLRNDFQPVPPPPFVKNAKAYERDAFAPTPICKVSPAGKARDLEMFRLTCTTGQYNPVTDELRLFDSIDFDVQFQGGNGYFQTRKAMSPFESTQIYSDSVLNGDIINNYPKPDEGPSSCIGEELLILTHPKFLPAAQELAKWKTDKGIVTSIFTVNDGSGNTGPDTKEEIDAFIESRYQKCQTRPSYVLLLGDVEYVPTFHVVTDLSANTGTDHPYALLTDNDQLGVPDFALGRISVDTLEEANIVVNKTIKYESKPPFNPAFYKKPMMATQFECCQMDLDEKGKDIMIPMRHVEFWAIRLASPYNIDPYEVDRFYVKTVDPNYKALAGEGVARRYYDGGLLSPYVQEENGFVWKFTGDQQPFADAINEGRFLVNYNAHGFAYGFSTPFFDNFTWANSLHNGELLPVVFSVSCATGMFDNEEANGEELANASYPTLGEWFLMNNNGGAVGFIGSTRTTYVDTAEAFMDGLFEAIWPGPSNGNLPTNRLGEIFNYGKLYLWGRVTADPDEWDSPTDAFYQFNLLGDPTLEMWTHDPHDFKLNLDFEYEVFDQFLQINYAVEGATITAYQATPNGVLPIGRGKVSKGVATLPFVNRPTAGVSLQFAAGLRNSASVKLAKAALSK